MGAGGHLPVCQDSLYKKRAYAKKSLHKKSSMQGCSLYKKRVISPHKEYNKNSKFYELYFYVFGFIVKLKGF